MPNRPAPSKPKGVLEILDALSAERRASALERFWAKVDRGQAQECWLWQSGTQRDGYGTFYVARGLTRVAHRVAYEVTIGPVPAGLELDHLCRVRHCVNPAHLEPVSHRENVIRGEAPAQFAAMRRAVTHCVHGHEFTPENTYIIGQVKQRRCRTCAIARSRSQRAAAAV